MLTSRPDHGRQIAAARAVLGLSMEDVAKAAGCCKQSVCNIENRGKLPRYNTRAAHDITELLERRGVTFETRTDGYAIVFTKSAVQ
jgi:DNA-binding XRE family transcriptional regulator